MSEQDPDDERLADRLGALYRGGDAEEPPPDLDRRILAAAAEARRRRRTWPLAGLGTAAVAVLAVALLLPRAFEAPEDQSLSRTEAPAAPAPEARARAQARPHEKVEEVVVTGALFRDASDARTMNEPPPAPSPAADARPGAPARADAAATGAEASSVRYAEAGCPEPHPLPPNATIRSLANGIRVEAEDQTFTLRCSNGQWQQTPAPER